MVSYFSVTFLVKNVKGQRTGLKIYFIGILIIHFWQNNLIQVEYKPFVQYDFTIKNVHTNLKSDQKFYNS